MADSKPFEIGDWVSHNCFRELIYGRVERIDMEIPEYPLIHVRWLNRYAERLDSYRLQYTPDYCSTFLEPYEPTELERIEWIAQSLSR